MLLSLVAIPEKMSLAIKDQIAKHLGRNSRDIKFEGNHAHVLPSERELTFGESKMMLIPVMVEYPAAKVSFNALLRPNMGWFVEGTKPLGQTWTKMLPGEPIPPPLRITNS